MTTDQAADAAQLSSDAICFNDLLPCELLDGVADAVWRPPDPRARSVAIAVLLSEIAETIEWLHDGDQTHPEVTSLRQVAAEAQAHLERMSALDDA